MTGQKINKTHQYLKLRLLLANSIAPSSIKQPMFRPHNYKALTLFIYLCFYKGVGKVSVNKSCAELSN